MYVVKECLLGSFMDNSGYYFSVGERKVWFNIIKCGEF